MRCEFFLVFMALLFVPRISVSEEPKLDLSQRYLILKTFRASTMAKELKEAIAGGYRVVNGHGCSESCGPVLLEKAEDGHDILILRVRGYDDLLRQLNEEAPKAFVSLVIRFCGSEAMPLLRGKPA